MGKFNLLGYAGERFYVNSAHAISRDQVDELFSKEAAPDGSIPLLWATDQSGGEVIGRVALCTLTQNLLSEITGQEYSKRQAQRLVKQMDFVSSWHGLPVTCISSLEPFVSEHISQARAHWIENLYGNKR